MKKILAEVLKEEYERLKHRDNFDTKDYSLTIKYLETGEYPSNFDEYDLLYACIEDFEQLCRDYDLN